jgi:amino acid adenylation domain-containing protein
MTATTKSATWGVTRRADAPVTLHEFVEQQAARTPDAIAVTAPDAEWTYARLDEQAERVAAGLRARGVGRGDLVGMAVDRSGAAVAAILGILKAGAAYVPLDPGYPADRLRFMTEDCAASVILHSEAAPSPSAATSELVSVEDLLKGEAAGSAPTPHTVTAADPAYVIYTSGSTGQPKGVVVPHRGIVNRILWESCVYPTGTGDTVLLRTSLSFDISLWEIFVPLSTGARLVVADPQYGQDIRYLVDLIRDEGVTCIALVPSLLQALLEDEPGLRACPALREVFCGGEVLPPALVHKFFSGVDAGLHNMYGPTEYSIDATYWDCSPDQDGTAVPIGHPLGRTRLHVLDPEDKPVPDGTPGELHIAGTGLALGYLNRPDLTRERFVPDPFDGGRMYRTGDLVLRRDDGALEFLGRADDQVKVRGFRVEPGEVERAILAMEGVEGAAVTTNGEGADARLVAYVTPTAAADAVQLRTALTSQLPKHMVPSQVVGLARLPLGPTGKVDKEALPSPPAPSRTEEGAGSEGNTAAAPASSEERIVSGVFAEVLGISEVPADVDFFLLGGSSLQAARLLTLLRKAVDADVPVSILVEHPTVAGIAAAIREAGANRG